MRIFFFFLWLKTWVWVNSRSWWWTGRPGVLQFMGSYRVGHDWETELNRTELNTTEIYSLHFLSEARRSQIKMLAKLVPFGRSKGESVPCLSPRCCWQDLMLVGLWVRHFLFTFVFTWWFPFHCVSASLLVRAPFFGCRAHFNLVWPHPNTTNCNCKDCVSK